MFALMSGYTSVHINKNTTISDEMIVSFSFIFVNGIGTSLTNPLYAPGMLQGLWNTVPDF